MILQISTRWTVVTDWHSWNVSTQNAFSLPFTPILVNCAPSGEMHNYCTPHIIKENFENYSIHRCNYTVYSYLKYIVYDRLLKPQQSFRITLYLLALHAFHHRYIFVCCIIQWLCSSQAVRVVSIRPCSTRVKCGIILRCMPFLKCVCIVFPAAQRIMVTCERCWFQEQWTTNT